MFRYTECNWDEATMPWIEIINILNKVSAGQEIR